jgi:hypothetical protein
MNKNDFYIEASRIIYYRICEGICNDFHKKNKIIKDCRKCMFDEILSSINKINKEK